MAASPDERGDLEVTTGDGTRREINVTPGHVPPPPVSPPPPMPAAPADTRPWFARVPQLTPTRIVSAFAIAVITDALQFALGPLGWVGIDQALDVIAMVSTTLLIGFHPLLLPTFILEAIPLIDAVPTWIACVGIVVALRKRKQRK